MPFGPNNVLVVYNSSDIASEELAMSYSTSKSIPNSNILSVSTDTDVSFDSLGEYVADLENPVISKINTLAASDVFISAIVLSFRIPPLILDTVTKATASRLASCMMSTRTPGTTNNLFLSLNEELVVSGVDHILCVTHLDASTLAIARARMNSITQASSSLALDGYVYIDANNRYENTQTSRQWVDSLSDAASNTSFNIISAPSSVDGANTAFPRIVDGSVVFSSGVAFAGTGYFNRTSRSKAFYFNADLDGFSSPRDPSSQKPAMKALEENYHIVAGMVGNPTAIDDASQYPDPRAILHCVQRDIPLGCAIIWSQRVVGEHLSVYGDPLSSFEVQAQGEVKFGALDGFFSAMSYIAQARAHSRTRELYASRILRIVAASGDVYFKQRFLNTARSISFSEDGMSVGVLSECAGELRNISKHVGYGISDDITMPSFEELITKYGKKIPLSFLRSTSDATLMLSRIGSFLRQPSGIATIEFRLPTISGIPRFFHIMVIATDDEGNQIFKTDSINRPDLWRHEAQPGTMAAIPIEGIYTSLAGRYIEFTHPEGTSPPLTRVHAQFYIITIDDSPLLVHEAEWRTQE